MIVGKVTGSIVSTRKSEKLIGNKLMIVEPLEMCIRDRARGSSHRRRHCCLQCRHDV